MRRIDSMILRLTLLYCRYSNGNTRRKVESLINREDMLELTRRFTVARSNITRIAGAYYDEEGELDGSFNTSFLNMSTKEKARLLENAKQVIFGETNRELKEYDILPHAKDKESVVQLLNAVMQEDLKNDALMETFYELASETIPYGEPFGMYVFRGAYDVPLKGKDHESQWESEEVYTYLLVSIFKIDGDYNPIEVECGFLYPAFQNRSSDYEHVLIYDKTTRELNQNLYHLLCR